MKYKKDPSSKFLFYKDSGHDGLGTNNGIYIDSAKDNDWGGGSSYWETGNVGTCTGAIGENCYVWIRVIGFVSDGDMYKEADKIIDGGDGPSKGSYRWITTGSGLQYHVFLKYAPYSKPV